MSDNIKFVVKTLLGIKMPSLNNNLNIKNKVINPGSKVKF